MCIYCTILPLQKNQIVFACGGLSQKCVCGHLHPQKKTQIFFRLRQTVWKCVYGHLVRSKVLDRVFFTPQKKAMFHLCLIVCPILICPLSAYPLSPCLILCDLLLSWRTRDKSADFLSAPGGILCTKNTFFVAKIPKYSIPPPKFFFSWNVIIFFS